MQSLNVVNTCDTEAVVDYLAENFNLMMLVSLVLCIIKIKWNSWKFITYALDKSWDGAGGSSLRFQQSWSKVVGTTSKFCSVHI